MRFDKLGVQEAILRIEVVRDQKRLIAAQQFLPMLDRVVKNESYLHMARERARRRWPKASGLPNESNGFGSRGGSVRVGAGLVPGVRRSNWSSRSRSN